ncbi:MAG: hypothetical protein AAB225_18660 [Acidobacteriota bacterium]
MEPLSIQIYEKNPGKLGYKKPDGANQHSAHAKRDDDVVWQCIDTLGGSPFAVLFGEKTPFDRYSYSASGGGTVTAKVRGGTITGFKYKYSVAVFKGSGAPLTDDPEIIIDEG